MGLSHNMWSIEAIDSAWLRHDELTVESLLEHENVREWVNSSLTRSTGFEELLNRANIDLENWKAIPLGVLPSGVGALTLAVQHASGFAVAKWTSEIELHESQLLAASIYQRAQLGPSVLEISSSGYLMERVQPGIPLRSFKPNLDNLMKVVELLRQIQDIRFSQLPDLPSLDQITKKETLHVLSMESNNPFFEFMPRQDLPTGEFRLAHGDLQLGNILTSNDDLSVIDGLALKDNGYWDAARLVMHSFVDAYGQGIRWDLASLFKEVSGCLEIDFDSLCLYAKQRAVLDGTRLFQSGIRQWEQDGYLFALNELTKFEP